MQSQQEKKLAKHGRLQRGAHIEHCVGGELVATRNIDGFKRLSDKPMAQ